MFYISKVCNGYCLVTDTTDNVTEKVTTSGMYKLYSQGVVIKGVTHSANGRLYFSVYNINPSLLEAKYSAFGGIELKVDKDGSLVYFKICKDFVNKDCIVLSDFCTSLDNYCISNSENTYDMEHAPIIAFDGKIKSIKPFTFSRCSRLRVLLKNDCNDKVAESVYSQYTSSGDFTVVHIKNYIKDENMDRFCWMLYNIYIFSVSPYNLQKFESEYKEYIDRGKLYSERFLLRYKKKFMSFLSAKPSLKNKINKGAIRGETYKLKTFCKRFTSNTYDNRYLIYNSVENLSLLFYPANYIVRGTNIASKNLFWSIFKFITIGECEDKDLIDGFVEFLKYLSRLGD